jgi:hypothetical protein
MIKVLSTVPTLRNSYSLFPIPYPLIYGTILDRIFLYPFRCC